MSHASGEVFRFDTKERIGFFEYNGTCDTIADLRIHRSMDELDRHWREYYWPVPHPCHVAKCEPTLVYLHSHYGGFYWTARACLKHRLITDGYDPSEHYSWHHEENLPCVGKQEPYGLDVEWSCEKHGEGRPPGVMEWDRKGVY